MVIRVLMAPAPRASSVAQTNSENQKSFGLVHKSDRSDPSTFRYIFNLRISRRTSEYDLSILQVTTPCGTRRVSWDTAGSTSCPHCAQYHGRRNLDVGPGETWARTWVRVRRRGWVQLLFAFMVGTKEKRGMCNPKQREECLSPPRPSFPPHMHTHTRTHTRHHRFLLQGTPQPSTN